MARLRPKPIPTPEAVDGIPAELLACYATDWLDVSEWPPPGADKFEAVVMARGRWRAAREAWIAAGGDEVALHHATTSNVPRWSR